MIYAYLAQAHNAVAPIAVDRNSRPGQKLLAIAVVLSLAVAVAAAKNAGHAHRTKFVYLLGGDDDYIRQFRVDARGRRQSLVPQNVAIRGRASAIVESRDEKSVYVPEGDYFEVAQFHVRANGTLVPMRQALARADAHPTALVFDPAGRHAYVSCSHGDVCQYRVAKSGSLVPLSPPSVSIAAGGVRNPLSVRFSHGGSQAQVVGERVDCKCISFRFHVKTDGELVLIGRTTLPTRQHAK